MNNEKYIAALKQALADMDRASREEILREIRSHLEDASDTESLEARFGPVEELAKQYLDGEPLSQGFSARLLNLGKTALLGIGGVALALALLVTGLIWFFSGDRFDYADETALAAEIDAVEWMSREWQGSIALEIEQAHTVLYWHDVPELHWRYKGRDMLDPIPGSLLKIRHGYCLLLLPRNNASMKISQSDVVLIRPRASVEASLDQASLRIAPAGDRNRYDFKLLNSEADHFPSNPDAITVVTVEARESTIQVY